MINSATMAMNYCDLMIIITHLNLHHPHIVNGSQWMDKNETNIYMQAYHDLIYRHIMALRSPFIHTLSFVK